MRAQHGLAAPILLLIAIIILGSLAFVATKTGLRPGLPKPPNKAISLNKAPLVDHIGSVFAVTFDYDKKKDDLKIIKVTKKKGAIPEYKQSSLTRFTAETLDNSNKVLGSYPFAVPNAGPIMVDPSLGIPIFTGDQQTFILHFPFSDKATKLQIKDNQGKIISTSPLRSLDTDPDDPKPYTIDLYFLVPADRAGDDQKTEIDKEFTAVKTGLTEAQAWIAKNIFITENDQEKHYTIRIGETKMIKMPDQYTTDYFKTGYYDKIRLFNTEQSLPALPGHKYLFIVAMGSVPETYLIAQPTPIPSPTASQQKPPSIVDQIRAANTTSRWSADVPQIVPALLGKSTFPDGSASLGYDQKPFTKESATSLLINDILVAISNTWPIFNENVLVVSIPALTIKSDVMQALIDESYFLQPLTKSGQTCPTPTEFKKERVTQDSITLSWRGVAEVKKYRIRIRNKATGQVYPEQTMSDILYTHGSGTVTKAITNLTPATEYDFRVIAMCEAYPGDTDLIASDGTEILSLKTLSSSEKAGTNTLEGTVKVADGGPITTSDIALTLYDLEPDTTKQKTPSQAYANSSGVVTFSNLSEGSYRLSVSVFPESKYDVVLPKAVDFTVNASSPTKQTAAFTFKLKAGNSVTNPQQDVWYCATDGNCGYYNAVNSTAERAELCHWKNPSAGCIGVDAASLTTNYNSPNRPDPLLSGTKMTGNPADDCLGSLCQICDSGGCKRDYDRMYYDTYMQKHHIVNGIAVPN